MAKYDYKGCIPFIISDLKCSIKRYSHLFSSGYFLGLSLGFGVYGLSFGLIGVLIYESVFCLYRSDNNFGSRSGTLAISSRDFSNNYIIILTNYYGGVE